MISFSHLGLVQPLQDTLRDEGYARPTPIQEQAIPHLLEGRDLLGCARTGTGKTAAFALPILQRLASRSVRIPPRSVRALVLVPTRELAAQVAASFRTYGKRSSLSITVVYGGVNQGPQVRSLARGADVLVATPGRLLDLMQQRHVALDRLEVVVIDEADHMLDLGFLPDVKRILAATPRERQTLLFSATMPPPIAGLAEGILRKPEKVFVTPVASTVEEVEQRVHLVERQDKGTLLAKLLSDPAIERALVFTRTKRGADRVSRRLSKDGIPAAALHGDKTQGARERTLLAFRDGRTRVLVATDIAARGIDVDAISHVINFEMPEVPETYVHRIGRTARAGATGVAISLCSQEERGLLRDIEKLIRRTVTPATGRGRRSEDTASSIVAPSSSSGGRHVVEPVPARRKSVAHGHGGGHAASRRPQRGQTFATRGGGSSRRGGRAQNGATVHTPYGADAPRRHSAAGQTHAAGTRRRFRHAGDKKKR